MSSPSIPNFEGDILSDPVSQEVYSRDCSIFRIKPRFIAHPKGPDDLRCLVDYSRKENIPLVPRGGATSTTGAPLGEGIVVDFSKYMNRILHYDGERELITVESGVLLQEVNNFLAPKGLRIGPETSTANRATLGGMTACNSSGARSQRFGTMIDSVEEIDAITLEGEALLLKEFTTEELTLLKEKSPLISRLLPWVEDVKEKDREEIEKRFAKGSRHVSGYPLQTLLEKSPPNLARLLVGSEGTLALFNTICLRCFPIPKFLGIVVIHFASLDEALTSAEIIRHWNPLSFELLDRHILSLARTSLKMQPHIHWMKGTPEALVIAEFEGENSKELKLRLSNFEADLRRQHIGYHFVEATNPEEMASIWLVRKEGLGLLMSKRSYTNAVAFLEDLAVLPQDIPSFCKELMALFRENDKEFGLYGHLGVGCLHLRPYLNLREEADLALMDELFEKVSSLVLTYQGALSGEHGDGLIRSFLNKKMFGEKLFARFYELKKIFDPQNLLNPGKIVSAPTFQEAQKDLRFSPTTTTIPLDPFLDFSKKGGLAMEIDLCNGNGLCRKTEGLMCPSFQATRDERDSTRGRAEILFALIHGKIGDGKFAGKEAMEILDLCLECKGCKRECPSSVDMAKLKMELLYQNQKEEGIDLRSRAISRFPDLLPLLSPFASLVNRLQETPLGLWAKKWLHLSPTRKLPKLAPRPFTSTYKKVSVANKEVVILIDTYTQFFSPSIGEAAEKVIEKMGFAPRALFLGCCGRPLFSKGRLEEGKKKALAYAKKIAPYIDQSYAILSLEPSCHSLMRDEYLDLKEEALLPLAKKISSFDEFVQEHFEDLRPHLKNTLTKESILLHRHCHDKALEENNWTLALLKRLPLGSVKEISSGCCGMAGSFGYEEEHAALSKNIAELVLLKTIREEREALLISNGFSCRNQIEELGERESLHLAEVVAKIIA